MQEPTGVSQLVEHLFRHEAGKMVATLTRIFGIERWNLAEDVVQEALSRALQTWPYRGIPENPSAWIMRASRNRALDRSRRICIRRCNFFRTRNRRRSIADDVRVLSSSHPAGRASSAGVENTLRLQRGGNQSCIPDDRSGDCQAIDARETKNPGSAGPIRDSRRRRVDAA